MSIVSLDAREVETDGNHQLCFLCTLSLFFPAAAATSLPPLSSTLLIPLGKEAPGGRESALASSTRIVNIPERGIGLELLSEGRGERTVGAATGAGGAGEERPVTSFNSKPQLLRSAIYCNFCTAS